MAVEYLMQDVVTLVIIVLNIILTLALFGIYYKNHRLVKSKLTLGLLFFALMFLLENIADLALYNVGFTTLQFAVNLLEMIGLFILLYVTWK